ncbi:glutathione S-transferase N-terminal domain-containing protein [Siccirubricoccus sp. KC 17139]|uniref:Glutathione S-transferase N-terminal domain-containing protein n=1 Tax=Siccirubricoccus soli TaxID=2899147 RepID=A0ABT1DFE5_9PROT|nr:glutathione S-transferase N-terminal domain-containing protein [Siccirubricoccus soli]MCO6419924.1 glutathione S-transferase N-terminal domain-containing protein [Siccirubricoccus soli]MCP2686059.1 glutathione S-transferase N-terminal domain-containing protein [Siccirubricoccus soli]
MKLYYAPGACSVGIHVLLEEIGKPYEAEAVNLRDGAQFKPEFTSINPKSKVPTLVKDDGAVITEFPAIATWLAASFPEAKLLPQGADKLAKALEYVDYAVATLHMQGFSRIFRPANYAPTESDHEAVKAKGEEIFSKGLTVFDKALEGKEYLLGEFSFADSALFYVSFWWKGRLGKELPPNVAAHYQRMLARPAVQRTLKAEGLA